jgi:hypothetical protein
MLNRSTLLSAVAIAASLAAFTLVPANVNAASSAEVLSISPEAPVDSAASNVPGTAALGEDGCGIFCYRVWRFCVCV